MSVCVCVKERERERERSPALVRALSVDGEENHLFGVVEESQKVPQPKKLSSPGLPHIEDLFLTIWKSFFRFKAIAKTIFRVVLGSQ